MEPYDMPAAPDPFAGSRICFGGLVEDLSGPAAAAMTHSRLEELVDGRGRELLRQLLQDHLNLRAVREEQAAGRGDAEVGGRRRIERGHHRELATVVGTVTVRRLAWRAPGLPNAYPADRALGLPQGRHSPGLARLAVIEAVRGSFDAAKQAIARRCGPVAGKRQVEQLVVGAAVDIGAFYANKIPVPCTAGMLPVLSVDGKGIVMRPEALRPGTAKAAARARRTFRTRLASGEKPHRKRMATLACVYDAKPAPRRPHDVIATPGGRSGQRTVRPGPRASAKWLTGSVDKDAAQVIAAAFDQAEARDPGHQRRRVVLVDGDQHQIELIEAEADRRGVPVHIVIDLVHVLEYLWSAAWCFFAGDDPGAEEWVAARALAVLAGHAARTAQEIDRQAAEAGLAMDQRRGADACVRYLRAKEEYLHYEIALAAGWPIATGVIEGACRHLIGDRLDITGARWGLEGAEAVLTLRALLDNGDFDAYWAFHVERERFRVHQACHRDGYGLIA